MLLITALGLASQDLTGALIWLILAGALPLPLMDE